METQDLLFGTPVDPNALALTLRGKLRDRRAQLVRVAITRPDKPREGISSLQADVLRRVLTEASPRGPAERPSCLDNWAVALALKNVFLAQSKTAFNLLLAELLFLPRGSSDSLLSDLSFNLPTNPEGTIHVPGAGMQLNWTGGAPSSLYWRCGPRLAEVRDQASGRSTTVPLPLTSTSADGTITVAPYDRVPRLDIAVLPRAAVETCGFATLPPYAPNGSSALTLVESVEGASQLLNRIWPERLAWTTALLPAIIDLDAGHGEGHRLSGSFEPGTPIYLSRVNEPFSHAEDLVHEIQHLRFPLTVPANEWFGRWTDMACNYTSPYRPDPRPLQGLHLGLHAFAAVTEFRLRALELGNKTPFTLRDLVDTHLRNLYALESILAHEELSSQGLRYYNDIAGRLSEQDGRIAAYLAEAGQVIGAESLRRAFIGERGGHQTLNAAIEFGAQNPINLLGLVRG
jgi:HEXXH motif-containing protein